MVGRFARILVWLRTLPRLGLGNVAIVMLYRLALRLGWYRWVMPPAPFSPGQIFAAGENTLPLLPVSSDRVIAEAERLLVGEMCFFSHKYAHVGSPPNWFANPFTGGQVAQPARHWSQIGDFSVARGDIKIVWEPSRFAWAVVLACAYRLTDDRRYMNTLNAWATDWMLRNPANVGPNWKCGQETALRLLNTLMTAFILGQQQTPTSAFLAFVIAHCTRIVPTRSYAIAQNNNHSTSEAAALFVGGGWLLSLPTISFALRRRAKRWCLLGRRILEDRISRLVQPDGSFSQNSLNYHRLLLDSLSLVEFWRQQLHLEPFSELLRQRLTAAVEWLYQLIDPQSGDGPNLGANDGALLLTLGLIPIRDYRPSIQLASVLFINTYAYQPGLWDEPLHWLGLASETRAYRMSSQASTLFSDGGYVTIHSPISDSWAFLRSPQYSSRPSHADALHFDMWYRGVNLLRDSGSFSYADDSPSRYLVGTGAHNTVQFDGHDQMPLLSRFLFGDWLRRDFVEEITESQHELSWSGGYTDRRGCRHYRTVVVRADLWRVTDDLVGFRSLAILRWRLAPGTWLLDGTRCLGENLSLIVQADVPLRRIVLIDGYESRYYLEETLLPIFEIEVGPGRATLVTEIHFVR